MAQGRMRWGYPLVRVLTDLGYPVFFCRLRKLNNVWLNAGTLLNSVPPPSLAPLAQNLGPPLFSCLKDHQFRKVKDDREPLRVTNPGQGHRRAFQQKTLGNVTGAPSNRRHWASYRCGCESSNHTRSIVREILCH